MRRLWLAIFATVPQLVGGVGTANAQMHGGGGGSWHGGHFHDGRFFHGGRFNNSHSNFRVFIGVPAFWWGAPYYPYYYPYSYYGGSYAGPVYGDPGPTTFIQQCSGTGALISASTTSWYSGARRSPCR